jgi:tetratricopeptide (TPR) repeat protein
MEHENGDRPNPLSADSVTAYVSQLRRLKVWAGNPSLQRLCRLTGIPRSTLSDALNLKRAYLPSLDFVKRYTRACGCTGAEIASWVSAWRVIQTASKVGAQSQRGEHAVVPQQLPAAARHFVGRTSELKRLNEIATSDQSNTTVTIVTITGQAGIGKTALALHWAHQTVDRFPDGQLYLDLRGFSPAASPVPPAEAIRYFLDALEVPPERIPSTMEAQAALLRTLVANRRMLLVLDNAVDLAQVRPLLPGSSAGLVLVTSRNRLTSLVAEHGAQTILLDLLTDYEAGQLLSGGSIDPDLGATETSAFRQLIEYCGRLPLALTIVAARAAAEPAWPLARLATELADERSRLDALETGDPDANVRVVFASSYRSLNAECRSLFRLLGMHPGPDFSALALASMAGCSPRRVRHRLDELIRSHLIDEPSPDRFVLHDLLRTYATELANAHDSRVERMGALHRLFDHYLHTACAAALLLDPGRDPIALAPLTGGAIPGTLLDYGQALRWFTVEHRVLLATIDRAADSGFGRHAWQLAWSVASYFDTQGRWDHLEATHEVALAAATRLDDRTGQLHTHAGIAVAQARRGRWDVAGHRLRQALDLCEQVNDNRAKAHVQFILSWVYGCQDRYRDALHHGELALELFQAVGNRTMQARALNGMGWDHALLGNYQQTLTYCQRALALLQELGDRSGEAATWDSLGYAHHRLGDQEQAVECYRTAVEISRDLDSRLPQAVILAHLGDAHHAAGNQAAARTTWRKAWRLFEELNHPGAEQVRVKLDQIRET